MAAVAITVEPTAALSASLALTVTLAVAITASPAASLACSIAMTVPRAQSVTMEARSGLAGALAVTVVKSHQADASPSASLAGGVDLGISRGLTVSASPRSALAGGMSFTGISDTMTLCDVVSNVLGMWGIFCRKSAPSFALAEAVTNVNHALQLVWNNAEGRDYWTNTTLTITLDDTESSQDLDDDVQNVTGPCRLSSNKQPLVPLGSTSELESFAELFLDGTATDLPVAYHIDRQAQTGSEPAKITFHVNQPIDGASVAFLLDVVKEAPRFNISDLSSCPVVPIPHRYVESLLLPVARYQASSFYLFRNDSLKATIDREYQQAAVSLGLADPLPGNSGDNQNKRQEGGKA